MQWHFPCEKVLLARNREQGWRSGENACFPPLWLSLDSGLLPHVNWVCCCILPCSEGFSPGPSDFLLPQKTDILNSNSTRIEGPHENQPRLMWLPLLILEFIFYLFMYLFIYSFKLRRQRKVLHEIQLVRIRR